MFESAELGHEVPKAEFDREEPRLRGALLDAQFDVLEARRFPVILVIGGMEGAGKGDLVNRLHSWLDAHYLRVHALGTPRPGDDELPEMWRFWRHLPPRGETGIFLGSWYTQPIEQRVHRRSKRRAYLEQLDRIGRFERMLVQEGALLVKFWLHLSRKAQRDHFRELEKDKLTAWRVTPDDWRQHAHYARYRKVSEETLRRTSTGDAPWVVIDAEDARYRRLTAGRTLLALMRRKLKSLPLGRARPKVAVEPPTVEGASVLSALELDRALEPARYDHLLEKYQGRLNRLLRDSRFRDRALVAVFEGPDAAGKGGAIERIIAALDARWYRVVPIGAPTEHEQAQPYLWRFWRALPRHRHAAFFDRSWYGRVLVERVEGLAAPADWMRAYGELNDFEEQLQESGAVVGKFWLQISPEVQLQRFREREATHYKRYKLTEDDWRNRKKWSAYQRAAAEMIDRTSTPGAPWHLVPANDKRYARVAVLRALVRQLERALGR